MIDLDETWEYLGKCKYCSAAMYFKKGLPVFADNPAEGCFCEVENFFLDIEEKV